MTEENKLVEETQVENGPEIRGCKNCGNPEIEEGYALDLCEDCRLMLSKRPIPIWIKGFALLIAAVMAIALIHFPSTLKAGIAYEKGQRFEAEGKYISAEREYQKVLLQYPDYLEGICQLFIAQYHNGEYDAAFDTYDKLVGKEVKNDATYNEITGITKDMDKWYYISDEFSKIMNTNKDAEPEKRVKALKPYVEGHSEEVLPSMLLADAYYDLKEYDKSKIIMIQICEKNPQYNEGNMLLAAIYRETKDFEKAEAILKNVMEQNSELASAHAAMARVKLKAHKDKDALDEALKAYGVDKEDPYVVASLALAYHYNHMNQERDKTYEQFKQLKSEDKHEMETLEQVFSGKMDWTEI